MITMKTKRAVSGMIFWPMVTLIFMLAFIAVAPPGAQAAIPRYINYQGKLTDADDNPVEGDVSITVRIYGVETGGTALWTETQTATVTQGVFSILLGNSEALDDLDFDDPYWYSVEVESDGEMTPRQRLTSVAYAINADKIDGYDASDFLAAAPSGALSLTGGANQNVEINTTGTGDVVITIDSTSGDFKITDGTTNYVLVDNATGNVTMAKDLTVSGTIYGTIASTGGSSTFTSLTVTGASDLRGNVYNSTGALTIPDAITQTGASNQVTFAGNVDAGNGLDVTGALTVSGAVTLSSGLDMNSNIDLDYSGTSAALNVTQASTGPTAQFAGGRVIVGANETTNTYALSTGELYVLGDLEVDGTIYGDISSEGATTLASLTVSGATDLKGNVSNSTGVFALADNAAMAPSTLTSAGTDDYSFSIAQTLNDTTASGATEVYRGIKLNLTETDKTGWDSVYLMDLQTGGTSKFNVDDSGNAVFIGTVTGATPTADTHLVTKAYADSITPATAGGWTDIGAGVYLLTAGDNVGIGTDATDTYKLNVEGSLNAASLYIGGSQVTSSVAELNKLDGYTGTMANLNTLTNASNADVLHSHAASSLTGNIVSSIDGITNDGGDIDFVEGANMTITPNDVANTITFASSASGDETATTNLTFTINSDNVAAGAANGTGIILDGGTGTDASIKFNSATNNIDIAGVTGGLSIPNAANYKINGTQIASTNLSDAASIGMLNEAETIAANWVNTANPWADNEVADTITASNYLPLAGGTMSGDITLGTAGTNIVTTGIDLDLSPASGYGVTSTVTRSAAEGDEAAYDLSATVNKLTSGNYTGIKLNVTETSAPGAADKLLDLQVGDASKFTVDNGGLITTASVNSASVVNDSITADDLNVNVVSSVDGVTNDGGDINLVAGDNITITPNDGANTITIAATDTDTVLSQEQVEDYAGAMAAAGSNTNLTVTYQDNGAAAGALDLTVTGVPVLAPASTQTITAADTGATPLILKGMAGQTANLMDVQDSAALSHLKVEADGDMQIDTSGADALASITQSNATASLAIATNTARLGGGAASDSDGVLKLGINEGNYQYLWYDTDAGTDGLGAFIFSDQAVIPTASPAYLNFGVDRDVNTGRYNQYYAIKLDPDVMNNASYSKQKFSVVSIPNPGANWQASEKPLFDISSDGSFNIYDPSMGDAVFQIEAGGKLAQGSRNLIKNGSFEAFSGFETFSGYDPSYSQSGVYNNTTTGYRGGWSNFAPDEWTWVEGKIVQHSPALFTASATGTFNTDFYDGKSALAINEWSDKRSLNYSLEMPYGAQDAGIKQTLAGLKPDTWYSIGAALMVTNGTTTKAILDITGEYKPTTALAAQINSGDTLNGSATSAITVSSNGTTNFPQGGTLKIDNELFDYTGKSSNSFTGVTRAVNSTTAATHTVGATVKNLFKPLVSANTSFEYKKGSFKTDSTGSDIVVYLLCQQTSGADNVTFARFDAVQLIEGKVLPKYGPTSIIDTGDQSIYGTLKLGRSADGRGGILAVDQFVRTRGIDFFSEDPGLSGTEGGSGIVGAPYSITNANGSPGTVAMTTSGYYIQPATRKYQVEIPGTYGYPSSYIHYRYQDQIGSGTTETWGLWSSWTGSVSISTSETLLIDGIKIKFSSATPWNGTAGYRGGDTWEFKAYGMSSTQSTYSSYSKDAAYRPSESRIYKDITTGELTFEDSKSGKVKLSEIISQKSTGTISPPVRDPANVGTLVIIVDGELSGSVISTGQTFEIMLGYDAGGTPTTFGWHVRHDFTSGTSSNNYYGNWGVAITRDVDIPLVTDSYSYSPGADTGITVKFPTGSLYNYERWTFYASPGSAANVATHHHANDTDGGSFGSGATTSQNFIIASALSAANNNMKLIFGSEASPNDKYIKWNSALSQFDISNNVNVSGTLTATNLSGPTSTSGTSNNTFSVDTDITPTETEPASGAGFVIAGGNTGNLSLVYDAANNYLNIVGQSGATNTFTGVNIPSGTKYKINGANLTATDVGAANSSHSHSAGDLPTAGAGTAGIIPYTGLTDAMVSGAAGIQTSKLADSTGITDAISKKHTQGTDTALGTMAAYINMGGYKVTNLGAPTTGTDAVTKTYVDNAIAGLHWKDPVKAIQADPPASPASGDRYVITTGTGAWSGQNNKIAVYNGSTWDFTTPLQSYAVFNKTDNAGYVYNGTSWVAFSGATAYTWSTGLTNNGTIISVDNTVVATLTGAQTLTNKTISGANNTLQNISDSSLNQLTTANKVAGTAVQLNPTGAITNATGLKVNLPATNPGLAITDNALDVKLAANQGLTKGADGAQVDYDDSTIGIITNKLAVKAGSIGASQIANESITSADILDGTIANADISGTAAIAQSKLVLSIKDAEVAADAAITTSKLAGTVTSIANHGLGTLATLSAVSGGNTGTITDGTIANIDIAANAAIAQSKLTLAITNTEVASGAAIATSKISGAVTSITNHGLGDLALLSAVSGGAGGNITDGTIANADISTDAAIATSKISGPVTSITNHGLGGLAILSSVSSATITDATITSADISAAAGILDSQLAASPSTRFYENFAEYVETGLLPVTSANLTSNISLGTAYVRGARIDKPSATPRAYTASKDTYVDINSSGVFQYTEAANGAAAPSVADNSIRLAKVVTDADNITAVTDLRNLYPVTANEISPGAVGSTGIEDGSVGTTKLADSAVTSIKIADGTIVNADVSDTAAIAGAKISPNFGSQNITTSGSIITTGAGVMTSAGLITAAAGMSVSGGNIAITDTSNIVLNTNKITLFGATGDASLAGALTQLRAIGFTPDYEDAALSPDGADNFGTVTLKYGSSHNYYEWTTSEPTTQDYDIVIRYRLPDGFSSFDATTPIKLWNKV
ncbi:MAG: DUF2793 domain-containing protein, partial [Candidatus Omnitrophota bacterium]|nr:DUF2793 domain-containing protein [Candidatus Omnitrophota bacterium]